MTRIWTWQLTGRKIIATCLDLVDSKESEERSCQRSLSVWKIRGHEMTEWMTARTCLMGSQQVGWYLVTWSQVSSRVYNCTVPTLTIHQPLASSHSRIFTWRIKTYLGHKTRTVKCRHNARLVPIISPFARPTVYLFVKENALQIHCQCLDVVKTRARSHSFEELIYVCIIVWFRIRKRKNSLFPESWFTKTWS